MWRLMQCGFFILCISYSSHGAESDGDGQPPMTLADEYLDFIQGGEGGGGEAGSCGGGAGDEGAEDNEVSITTGVILLKPFRAAYEKLDEAKAKKQFSDYLHKLDRNKDGFIDVSEVKSWTLDQGRQHRDELDLNDIGWTTVAQDGDGKVSWETLVRDLKDPTYQITPFTEEDERKEKEKFQAADLDKDGVLTQNEYRAYTFPDLFPYMADYLKHSTIRDFDQDKDGKITREEYDKVVQALDPTAKGKSRFPRLDKNGDGLISSDEEDALVADYGLGNVVEEESRALVNKADGDGDGKLSYSEAIENYDLFVYSQPTQGTEEYENEAGGEQRKPQKDEL